MELTTANGHVELTPASTRRPITFTPERLDQIKNLVERGSQPRRDRRHHRLDRGLAAGDMLFTMRKRLNGRRSSTKPPGVVNWLAPLLLPCLVTPSPSPFGNADEMGISNG